MWIQGSALRFALASTALAACTVLAGCDRGPATGRVTGTVTLDGDPLPNAEISFYPEEGRASSGVTDEEGRYELMFTFDEKGCIPGNHTVAITTERYASDEEGAEMLPELVPARYKEDGALTAVVEDGPNTIDFALTTEPSDG